MQFMYSEVSAPRQRGRVCCSRWVTALPSTPRPDATRVGPPFYRPHHTTTRNGHRSLNHRASPSHSLSRTTSPQKLTATGKSWCWRVTRTSRPLIFSTRRGKRTTRRFGTITSGLAKVRVSACLVQHCTPVCPARGCCSHTTD